MIILGVIDLDLVLRVKWSADLTNKSFFDDKRDMERCDCSNRMSHMIMKHDILEAFKGTIPEKVTTAKGFPEKIEKKFSKSEKVETSTLLANLISMRYKGKGNIRDYTMEMSNLASKMKAFRLDLSDLLVCLVLISVPA